MYKTAIITHFHSCESIVAIVAWSYFLSDQFIPNTFVYTDWLNTASKILRQNHLLGAANSVKLLTIRDRIGAISSSFFDQWALNLFASQFLDDILSFLVWSVVSNNKVPGWAGSTLLSQNLQADRNLCAFGVVRNFTLQVKRNRFNLCIHGSPL